MRATLHHGGNKIFTSFLFLVTIYLMINWGELVQAGEQSEHSRRDKNEFYYRDLFLASVNANSAKEFLEKITERPHLAGSPNDYTTALYLQNKLEEFGFTTEIQEIEAALSYPGQRHVEVVYPPQYRYVAQLHEPPIIQDAQTAYPDIIPPYNAYSGSGDVTAQVVYANYGTLDDYAVLASNNISVAGKIVLARYGQIFRGAKAMIAQMYGAVGLLLYSDPIDSGYGTLASPNPVYPNGPWRPPTSVERGSVLFIQVCPGNPTPDRTQFCINENSPLSPQIMPSIPVIPLSYADATPILRSISVNQTGNSAGNSQSSWNFNGTSSGGVPASWVGGLDPSLYQFGPGPGMVRLSVGMQTNTTTIWNVVAKLVGTQEPDRFVLIGNHRDAWAFGAADPGSGTAALLEMARSFKNLMDAGWRPRRSILICSWDGEEHALIGSTHYAETYRVQLQQQAVAYLNIDAAVAGKTFVPKGTPSLAPILRAAAWLVTDPYTGLPFGQVWDGQVGPLGCGSDYTAFLDYLGLPSLDIWKNDAWYGVYHSAYDTFNWMAWYGDGPVNSATSFAQHKQMAQLTGLLTLQLADSYLLPLNYTEYALQLGNYLGQVRKMLGNYGGGGNLDLNGVQAAIDTFTTVALDIENQRNQIQRKIQIQLNHPNFYSFSRGLTKQIKDFNDKVQLAERQFLARKGLARQGRPWFKHVVQAPALYDGYNSDIFPGVTQAIRDGNWAVAQLEAGELQARITAVTKVLKDGPNSVPHGNESENEISPYAGPHSTITILATVWGVACVVGVVAVVAFLLYQILKQRKKHGKDAAATPLVSVDDDDDDYDEYYDMDQKRT